MNDISAPMNLPSVESKVTVRNVDAFGSFV